MAKHVYKNNERVEVKRRVYHEDITTLKYINSQKNGADWTRQATKEKMEKELSTRK